MPKRLVSGWRTQSLWLVLLTVSLALIPSTSRAAGCFLSGDLGTFKVARIDVPPGGTSLSLSAARHSAPYVLADDQNYYDALGVFIFEGSRGGTPDAYIVSTAGDGAPRAVIELNGHSYINQWVPARVGVQGGIEAFSQGSLGGGATYYVIAYGWGSQNGLVLPGGWWASINASGLPCTEVPAQGEIVNHNQAHFSGGAQVYVPGTGIGSGLSLTTTTSRSLIVGSVYASAKATCLSGSTCLPGKIDLTYDGTHHVGTTVNDTINPYIAGSGSHLFKLEYYGVDPLADLNWLQLDILG